MADRNVDSDLIIRYSQRHDYLASLNDQIKSRRHVCCLFFGVKIINDIKSYFHNLNDLSVLINFDKVL